MGICAGFSGGFLQIVSIAAGMTGSNEPSRRSDARTALALDHAINVRIDITGNPDAGLIVQRASGGVDHEKNGKMNSETGSQSVASVLMVNRWAMRPTRVL